MRNRTTRRASIAPTPATSTDLSRNRERSIVRRSSTPQPSTAALVEDWTQMNAQQLQSLQFLEERLTALTANLQDGERNRNDTIAELTENMQMLCLNLAAEQKSKLIKRIKDGIADCRRAKTASSRATDNKRQEINKTLDIELEEHDQAQNRVNDRYRSLEDERKLLIDLSRSHLYPQARSICDRLWSKYQSDGMVHEEDHDAIVRAKDLIYDRADEQKRQNDKTHHHVVQNADKSIREFRRIARVLGVENEVE